MFQLPPVGRLITKLNPKAQWGWLEHFANRANYLLELQIWHNATPPKNAKQSDKDKHKKAEPKLFIPDFLKEPEPKSAINEGSVAMDVDDIKRILEQRRQ